MYIVFSYLVGFNNLVTYQSTISKISNEVSRMDHCRVLKSKVIKMANQDKLGSNENNRNNSLCELYMCVYNAAQLTPSNSDVSALIFPLTFESSEGKMFCNFP